MGLLISDIISAPSRRSQRERLVHAQRSQEQLEPIKSKAETLLKAIGLIDVRPAFIYSDHLNQFELSLEGFFPISYAEKFVAVLNEMEKTTKHTFNFKEKMVKDKTGDFRIEIIPTFVATQMCNFVESCTQREKI